MTKAKYTPDEVKEAADELRAMLAKAGNEVYCKLNHISRSGMYRSISLYVALDGKIVCIDWYAIRVLDEKLDRHNGIPMGGCGMDMGFQLVYSLSRMLYPDEKREGDFDRKGGYHLKHHWM